MAVRVSWRNELAAALERGDVAAPRRGDAMYVGNIKLASAKGHLTQAGYAWIKMGGVDPVRYSGELIEDGDSKYVIDSGRRVDILKLHQTPKGPEWRPTKRGYLRFREHNQWEVMIPAIGHAKDKNGKYRSFRIASSSPTPW